MPLIRRKSVTRAHYHPNGMSWNKYKPQVMNEIIPLLEDYLVTIHIVSLNRQCKMKEKSVKISIVNVSLIERPGLCTIETSSGSNRKEAR